MSTELLGGMHFRVVALGISLLALAIFSENRGCNQTFEWFLTAPFFFELGRWMLLVSSSQWLGKPPLFSSQVPRLTRLHRLISTFEHSCDGESMARREVYQEYLDFCQKLALKPTTAEIFGRIVRLAFPTISSRRLGRRGSNIVHYYNFRKKVDPTAHTSSSPAGPFLCGGTCTTNNACPYAPPLHAAPTFEDATMVPFCAPASSSSSTLTKTTTSTVFSFSFVFLSFSFLAVLGREAKTN